MTARERARAIQSLMPCGLVRHRRRATLRAMFADTQKHGEVEEPRTTVRRSADMAFQGRGEEAWQEYLRTGVSFPVDAVFDRVQERINAKRLELLAGRD